MHLSSPILRRSKNARAAFSMVEMLIGTVLVGVLGAAAYKLLASNTQTQYAEISGQQFNKQAIEVSQLIQNDLRSISIEWHQRGVNAIYPHPMLGPDGNSYLGSANGGVLTTKASQIRPRAMTAAIDAWANTQGYAPLIGGGMPASMTTTTGTTGGSTGGTTAPSPTAAPTNTPATTAVNYYDAVTFLTRNSTKRTLFQLTNDQAFKTGSSFNLVGGNVSIPIKPAPYYGTNGLPQIAVGDTVLIRQTKQYILARVAALTAPTPTPSPTPTPTATPKGSTTKGIVIDISMADPWTRHSGNGYAPLISGGFPAVLPVDTSGISLSVPLASAPAAQAAASSFNAAPAPATFTGSTVNAITFQRLDANVEVQGVKLLGGYSNGHVLRAGVIEASFDSTGTYTTETSDDNVTFSAADTVIEVVKPISYRLMYRTISGTPPDTTTDDGQYEKDTYGDKTKYFTRIEYVWSGNTVTKKYNYILPLDSLNFSYDVALSSNSYLDGEETGDVFQDAGLKTTNASGTTDPLSYTTFTGSTLSNMGSVASGSSTYEQYRGALYKIIGVHAWMTGLVGDHQRDFDIKVSLTDPLMRLRYQTGQQQVAVTKNLYTDETGQPLLLNYGDGTMDMAIPMNSFNLTSPEQSLGRIAIRDQDGKYVNNGASDASKSEITFCNGSYTASTRTCTGQTKAFLPNAVVSWYPNAQQSPRLIVGGFQVTSSPLYARVPALAVIDLTSSDYKLRNVLGSGSNNCASLSSCKVYDLPGFLPIGLADTAGGITVLADSDTSANIYVSSMTKLLSISPLSIWKGTWDNTNKQFTVPLTAPSVTLSSIGADSSEQMITGALGKVLTLAGKSYLAAGTSNKNDGTFTGGVYAIPINSSTKNPETPKLIATHNYFPSGLDSSGGTLVVGGRLTVYPISPTRLSSMLLDSSDPDYVTPSKLYLDDVASWNADGTAKTYADYFQVDSSSIQLSSASSSQVIGAIEGINLRTIDPLSFFLTLTNKVNPAGGSGVYHDASLSTVYMQGSAPRIMASIEKDTSNFNNSRVRAVYSQGSQTAPTTIPPGTLYGASTRTSYTKRGTSVGSTLLPSLLDTVGWARTFSNVFVPHGQAPESGLPSVTTGTTTGGTTGGSSTTGGVQ